MYSLDVSNVQAYDPLKLKVLTGSVAPLPLRDRLPPAGQRLLDEHRSTIYRPQSQIDQMVESGAIPRIVPYWDAGLKYNRVKRLEFFTALHRIGLVSFRLRISYRVGCFFVGKKGREHSTCD
jgi:hypothetical protein